MLQVVLIVIVALVALRLRADFVHGVFQTLLDREAREGRPATYAKGEIQRRMTTLDALGASLAPVLIVVIAGLMILGRLGIDIGPAIAGLGIVGIAIGFGAQSLVRDYFNGVLILIENQYDKGDVVRIAGVEGTVEDLTLRRTTLRDFAGNVHTVPNSAVTVASNLTRGYAVISEDILVPSAELVEPATDVINGVGRALADDPKWADLVLEPPHVERIDALGVVGDHVAGLGPRARRATAGRSRASCGVDCSRPSAQHGLPLVPSAGPAPSAAPATPPRRSSPDPSGPLRRSRGPGATARGRDPERAADRMAGLERRESG